MKLYLECISQIKGHIPCYIPNILPQVERWLHMQQQPIIVKIKEKGRYPQRGKVGSNPKPFSDYQPLVRGIAQHYTY